MGHVPEKNIYFKVLMKLDFSHEVSTLFDEDRSTHRRPSRIMFMHVCVLETCHISNRWKCGLFHYEC